MAPTAEQLTQHLMKLFPGLLGVEIVSAAPDRIVGRMLVLGDADDTYNFEEIGPFVEVDVKIRDGLAVVAPPSQRVEGRGLRARHHCVGVSNKPRAIALEYMCKDDPGLEGHEAAFREGGRHRDRRAHFSSPSAASCSAWNSCASACVSSNRSPSMM